MVTAEIVAVGDELVSGACVDSNSAQIAEMLLTVGVEARLHTVVGDDPGDLENALRTACGRARFVIVTGGLGPTEDDRTRAVAAKVAGQVLVRDQDVVRLLEERFAERGLKLTPSNHRQADYPEGGRILPNAVGTAPGFEVKVEPERHAKLVKLRRERLAGVEGFAAPDEQVVKAVQWLKTRS